MIYKFQPFSTTKELGKEYNAHCSLVPDPEDWILILDYDTMILDPRAYMIMERAIAKYPGTEIFGAYCNRVGHAHQRVTKEMDQRDSMRTMMVEAMARADMFLNGESIPISTAAGFFLLFQKKYWEENKFQKHIYSEETFRLFDWQFCREAARKETVKIIQGIQVWHSYRLLHKDYRSAEHLKL